jgi:DNA-binding LacI/PurR family transcriptional regulator
VAVRLSDVAALAGVSVKTVSNVVHGYRHVRPATRARVQAALEELDYRPNLSARSLRRGRSGVVALAVPSLEVAYFAELASAVVAAAATLGWTVLVDQTDGVAEREMEVARGLRGHLIDGLILSPMALGAGDLQHTGVDTPVVLLGERISGAAIDHVAVDNVAASCAAVQHLVDIDRRRIAAIGFQAAERASSGVADLRARGYRQVLADCGLTAEPHWTPYVSDYDRTEGAIAMAQVLDGGEPPDAVFCFSDALALGALYELTRRGLRVPEDVAVVGFDDIEDGRFSNPPLTTIAPDRHGIARHAVEMLNERIGGEAPAPGRDVQVPFELVVRGSTTPAV